jgi:hypothetical protein
MAEYVDPDDVADDVGGVLEGNATLVVPVITTAAARFITNPGQLSHTDASGPFSRNVVGGFTGWTLAEQFVLNRYRKRAI